MRDVLRAARHRQRGPRVATDAATRQPGGLAKREAEHGHGGSRAGGDRRVRLQRQALDDGWKRRTTVSGVTGDAGMAIGRTRDYTIINELITKVCWNDNDLVRYYIIIIRLRRTFLYVASSKCLHCNRAHKYRGSVLSVSV